MMHYSALSTFLRSSKFRPEETRGPQYSDLCEGSVYLTSDYMLQELSYKASMDGSMQRHETEDYILRKVVTKMVQFYSFAEYYTVIQVHIMDIGDDTLKAVADYDYSFLMNYYDGRQFHMWFPLDILTRVGYFNQVTVHVTYSNNA